MQQNYKLIYILGSGRCGSTLLDLLLNGHSQILGLGEISSLNTVFKPLQTPDRMAERFRQFYLPLWQEVKRCYESTSGAPFEQIDLSHPRWKTIPSWGTKDIERWARPNKLLFSCIQRVADKRILTDASKVSQRLYLLCKSGLCNIQVIHLLRDGRAVVNSYIGRYNDFAGGLRLWVTTALLSFYLRRKFKQTDWLQVKYEDLATRPEHTLKSICAFLGINFEIEMLAFRTHPYFGIGGNPLVRECEDEDIVLDERWKQELSRKHRLIFALIAGWLNALYRY